MARFDSFLRLVAEQGASDLHFHAGNVPIVRQDGELMPLPFRVLSELETSRFLREIMTVEQRAEFEKKRELDFVYELPGVARFRANVFVQSQGLGSVFRVIKNEVPTLDQLGMPRAVDRLTRLNNGLVIQAAETGVLVIGTLHANSAAKAIDRIIDVIPEESREQMRSTLSVLLRGVISQHLVKHAAGEGRVAVLEILLQNYAIAHLIRENKVFQIDGYLETASNDGSGVQSLDACIMRYLKDGLITVEEAVKVANQPDAIKAYAAQMPEDA